MCSAQLPFDGLYLDSNFAKVLSHWSSQLSVPGVDSRAVSPASRQHPELAIVVPAVSTRCSRLAHGPLVAPAVSTPCWLTGL